MSLFPKKVEYPFKWVKHQMWSVTQHCG